MAGDWISVRTSERDDLDRPRPGDERGGDHAEAIACELHRPWLRRCVERKAHERTGCDTSADRGQQLVAAPEPGGGANGVEELTIDGGRRDDTPDHPPAGGDVHRAGQRRRGHASGDSVPVDEERDVRVPGRDLIQCSAVAPRQRRLDPDRRRETRRQPIGLHRAPVERDTGDVDRVLQTRVRVLRPHDRDHGTGRPEGDESRRDDNDRGDVRAQERHRTVPPFHQPFHR
jgi:hypothetical protein